MCRISTDHSVCLPHPLISRISCPFCSMMLFPSLILFQPLCSPASSVNIRGTLPLGSSHQLHPLPGMLFQHQQLHLLGVHLLSKADLLTSPSITISNVLYCAFLFFPLRNIQFLTFILMVHCQNINLMRTGIFVVLITDVYKIPRIVLSSWKIFNIYLMNE